MLKYHIKITDNETGEVIEDSDALAVIGSIAHAESVAVCAMNHRTTNFQLAASLIAANDAIEHVVNNSDPRLIELIETLIEERGESDE